MRNRLLHRLLICCFFALPFATLAGTSVSVETLCLTDDGAKPVQLEMRIYVDPSIRATTAVVKYARGKAWIPLAQIRRAEVLEATGRPAEVTEMWYELGPEGVTGEYEFVHQGTSVISLTYTSRKSKKRFEFRADTAIELRPDGSCSW